MKFLRENVKVKNVSPDLTIYEYCGDAQDIPIDAAVAHFQEKISYPLKSNKDFCELLFVINGRLKISFGKEDVILNEWDIILLKPGIPHQIFSLEETKIFIVCNPPFDPKSVVVCDKLSDYCVSDGDEIFRKSMIKEKKVDEGLSIDEYCEGAKDIAIDGAVAHFQEEISYPLKYNNNFYELFYVLRGQVKVLFENETVTLNEGDVVLLEPKIQHTTYSKNGVDVFISCYPPFEIENVKFVGPFPK